MVQQAEQFFRLDRIKEIAAQKNIQLKDIAASIGMTPQGLSKLIRENSTRYETIHNIATYLDCDVTEFFTESYSNKITEFERLSEENKELKEKYHKLLERYFELQEKLNNPES